MSVGNYCSLSLSYLSVENKNCSISEQAVTQMHFTRKYRYFFDKIIVIALCLHHLSRQVNATVDFCGKDIVQMQFQFLAQQNLNQKYIS